MTVCKECRQDNAPWTECIVCGVPIQQKLTGRPRFTCSDAHQKQAQRLGLKAPPKPKDYPRGKDRWGKYQDNPFDEWAEGGFTISDDRGRFKPTPDTSEWGPDTTSPRAFEKFVHDSLEPDDAKWLLDAMRVAVDCDRCGKEI